jgi:uncharacterized membrane protein YfhO
VLRLRVTALPGWHATVDGKAVPLATWSEGAMLQLHVPVGRHVVDLQYWPDLFTDGLVVAAAVVVGLGCAGVWSVRRHRRAAPAHGETGPPHTEAARPSHSR